MSIVSLATMLGFVIQEFLTLANINIVMVYLLGVSLVARFGELGPSLLTIISSVILFDLLFIPDPLSFDLQTFNIY